MKYKFVDGVTSDVMFEAYGKTFEELLENSAEAMFSVICEIKKVKPKTTIKIKITSESTEKLLHNWLSTLLTQSEINGLFLSQFKVDKLRVKGPASTLLCLYGTASGESISPEKSGTLVKGVTYYNFEITEVSEGHKARVTLDI